MSLPKARDFSLRGVQETCFVENPCLNMAKKEGERKNPKEPKGEPIPQRGVYKKRSPNPVCEQPKPGGRREKNAGPNPREDLGQFLESETSRTLKVETEYGANFNWLKGPIRYPEGE